MHKFEKGERVVIRDVISTRRKGQEARVIAIKPSKFDRSSLDKYIVVFPDGEQEEFWDIQLERSPPPD